MTTTKVITWQAPSGATVDITPAQEEQLRAAGKWLRDSRGEEYCSVSHGLHSGEPSHTDTEINEFCS